MKTTTLSRALLALVASLGVPAAMAQAHERLEHLVQRGSPDFPVNVLGL